MKKRILTLILAVGMILGCVGVCYADGQELEISAIEYTDASGKVVAEFKQEPITAMVTVKNNSSDSKRPVLVIADYGDGMLNGIWYEQADTAVSHGSSADIRVDFTPVSAGGKAEVKAIVLDNMSTLLAESKVAVMASNSTDLEKILVNGTALENYSNTTNRYLYKTTSAISSIEAVAVDGGQKISVGYANDFPGINSVSVTAANGSTRAIEIVAYRNDSDLSELIPTVTIGTGLSPWSGTGSTDSEGRFVVTGTPGAADDRHIRYPFGGIPAYEIGGNNILRAELTFTATKYMQDKNNGKILIDIRTSDSGSEILYNSTYFTAGIEEGKTYTIRLIFDKDRVCHAFLGNEHLKIPINKNEDKKISSMVLAWSSPTDASASNVLTFENPIYSIYPASYDIITNSGDVGRSEEMFRISPSMEVGLGQTGDYMADITPIVLKNGGYPSADVSVLYEKNGSIEETDSQEFDLSAMQQGKPETIIVHIGGGSTTGIDFMGQSAAYALPNGATAFKGIKVVGYRGSDMYSISSEKFIKPETVYEYTLDNAIIVGKNLVDASCNFNVLSYAQNEDYNFVTMVFVGKNSSGNEVAGAQMSIPMAAVTDGDVYPVKFNITKDRKVTLNFMGAQTAMDIPAGVTQLTGIRMVGIKGTNDYSITDYDSKVYSENILSVATPTFASRDSNSIYTDEDGVFTVKKKPFGETNNGGTQNTLNFRPVKPVGGTGFIRFSMNVTPFGNISSLQIKPNMLSVRVFSVNGAFDSAFKLDFVIDLKTHEVRYYKDGAFVIKTVPGEGSESSNGAALSNFEMWINTKQDVCDNANLISFSNAVQYNYSESINMDVIESEIAAE